MNYRNYSITDVGLVRKANEDNYGDAQSPNGHVFVVCDGMGGHVGGAKASSIAVTSILEYFHKEKYSNLIQAIDRSLSFANEQIFASALSDPELKGMGTTAVILVISGEDCFIGHVGDSRIYIKSKGKLNRITKDDSFVQTLVDSGVISDEEAEFHPKKNQILKALGIASSIEGTVCQSPIKVAAGDVFLMCSDGLNGLVKDTGLEMMLQAENIQKSGEDLIRAAKDAGGYDNITATIIAIDQSKHLASEFVSYNPKAFFDGASTEAHWGNASKKKPFFSSKKGIIILSSFGLLLLLTFGYVLMPKDKEQTTSTNTTGTDEGTDTEKGQVVALPDPPGTIVKKEPKKQEIEKKDTTTKTKTKTFEEYRVKQGDNISSITDKTNTLYGFNNSPEDIIKLNCSAQSKLKKPQQLDLKNEDKVILGTTLLIPISKKTQ